MSKQTQNDITKRLRKFLKRQRDTLLILAVTAVFLVFAWLGNGSIFQGEGVTPSDSVPPRETEDQGTTGAQSPTASPVLQPAPTLNVEQARQLADLGRIAFTASFEGRRNVWVINPDGTEEQNLTGDLPYVFAEAPTWSPDGQYIAFDGFLGDNTEHEILLVSLTDPQPELIRLTDHPAEDCYPSFSPDGQRIVFKSERSGNRDLFVMNMDGSNLIQLTDHPAADYEPAWSPDGSEIAFVSRRSGDSEIYIMDADASNIRQLTDHYGLDWRPAWSPDGEWIAFESYRNGTADIFIMRPDGSDLRQLTENKADDGHPTFSPDGQYLVFHSMRTGEFQLFIMRIDEPEVQWHLPTTSVRALLPEWSPSLP